MSGNPYHKTVYGYIDVDLNFEMKVILIQEPIQAAHRLPQRRIQW